MIGLPLCSRSFLPRKFGKKSGFERRVLKIGWINHQLCWLFFWMWLVTNYLCCFLSFFSHFFWIFFGFLLMPCFVWRWLYWFLFLDGLTPKSHHQNSYTFRNRDFEQNLHLATLTGRLDPSFWLIDFLEKKMFAEESYQDFKAQLRKEVLNGPPTERGVGEPHWPMEEGWIGWIRKGRTITRCWKKIAPGSCRLIFGHTRESKDNGVVEL